MALWSAMSEGVFPYRQFKHEAHWRGLLVALSISCVNAAILNFSQCLVVKHLGAVGASLVAQTKSVLTVMGGMALYNEQLTSCQHLGFALVMVGVYAYTRMETGHPPKVFNVEIMSEQKAKGVLAKSFPGRDTASCYQIQDGGS